MSKKIRKNGKHFDSAYLLVAAVILCIVLGLILAIDTQAMVDGNDTYRTYATLASWIAATGAAYSLLGMFILRGKRRKILLGISILIFAGLFLYSQYVANFIVAW